MAVAEPLPWHAAAWDRLRARILGRTLPHALLITGLPGLGKHRLADRLASALLCDARRQDATACGECRSCRLLEQGVHPDFRVLAPEEEGRQIKVDQVRVLIGQLFLRSQHGGYRVGLIDPADRMNAAAANALLKTLEEPPAGVVLLLTVARPSLLPATVRSRCQPLQLVPPPEPVAREWLRAQGVSGAQEVLGLAAGAPLRAVELYAARAQDRWRMLLATLERLQAGRIGAVAAAADCRELGREVIPTLIAVCADLARLIAGGEARFGDPGRLRGLAQAVDLTMLHDYVEQLLELRRHLEHPLNEQLLLERAFAGWQAAAREQRLPDAGR
jgi:DNA polymerase-3 subunit delta'